MPNNEDNLRLSRTQNNNLSEVYIGRLTVWFSYETPVAFAVPGLGRRISENIWGSTTGKHLNSIAGQRVPREQFNRELAVLMEMFGKLLDPEAITAAIENA